MTPSPKHLREILKREASNLGFHRIGVTSVDPPQRFDIYRTWLTRGYHGSMSYMAAPSHVEGRADLKRLATTARSLVVVALAYSNGQPLAEEGDPLRGRIARYARGRDYHHIIKVRLRALVDTVSALVGRPIAARACTDSAPVLERDLAERAGIGFIGKNTMLISPGLGSYTVLGELLLDIDVAHDKPTIGSRCGNCRACIDACPTNAFPEPFVLDARRCISYLTIEHRNTIDEHLRPAFDNMIFGCDRCQDVCPYNAAAPLRTSPDPDVGSSDPQRAAPPLAWLARLGTNQRRKFVDGTALRRADRTMLLRNVAIALGNSGDRSARESLTALCEHPSDLVKSHAAWGLKQLEAEGTM